MNYFQAPWSRSLTAMSLVFSVILFVASATLANALPDNARWLSALLPAMLVYCALSAVRGYTIAPDAVLVKRLFWSTRVSLAGLQLAEFAPDVMRGSIRTFGIAGLFSITGLYKSNSLGAYRAYVTDHHRTVVLRLTDRVVVLSPASPEEFVRELSARAAIA